MVTPFTFLAHSAGSDDELPAELADLKDGSAQTPSRAKHSRSSHSIRIAKANCARRTTRCQDEQRLDLGAFYPEHHHLGEGRTATEGMAEGDALRVVDLLASLHHGVLAMSPDVPGLVQNSTNLATLSLNYGEAEIVASQRSAIESSKHARRRALWPPRTGSPASRPSTAAVIRMETRTRKRDCAKLQEVNRKSYGEPAKLAIMHAGLECGVIGEKYRRHVDGDFRPADREPAQPK